MRKIQKILITTLLFAMIIAAKLPVSAASNYTPKGCVDHIVMSSSTTSVNVKGWAYIPSSSFYSVEIQVYFDNNYCGRLFANKFRPDVNNVFHCGNYHGFEGNINIPKKSSGYHTIYIRAYNRAKGKKVLLKSQRYHYISPLTNPVSNYSISQSFANYSSSMSKKGRPYHAGVDLVSNNKTIKAASSGVVVYTGYSSGNGNHIIIQTTVDGTTVKMLYSHLASIYVKKGKIVSAGTSIGLMGNTGNSTGTHLHFAVMSTNAGNDPLGYVSNKNSTNKIINNGITYYNPIYVLKNGTLPK